MSTMATGPSPLIRPGANSGSAGASAGAGALAAERLGRVGFKRFSTSGQARIGHEILVRVEGRFAPARHDSLRAPIRRHQPALLVVRKVGDHDLVEYLLVHG